MAIKIIFLEEFGKAFVPKKLIPNIRSYILKCGFNEVPYKFFGMLFYFSALITTSVFIVFIFTYLNGRGSDLWEIWVYSFLSWTVIQLFLAALFIMMIYFYLDFKIYYRTKVM